MGKRILQRRRGKGGLQWRVSSQGQDRPRPLPADDPEEARATTASSRSRRSSTRREGARLSPRYNTASTGRYPTSRRSHGSRSGTRSSTGLGAAGGEREHPPAEEDPRGHENLEHRASRRRRGEARPRGGRLRGALLQGRGEGDRQAPEREEHADQRELQGDDRRDSGRRACSRSPSSGQGRGTTR